MDEESLENIIAIISILDSSKRKFIKDVIIGMVVAQRIDELKKNIMGLDNI